jgi:hypothetical protein
VDQLQLKENMTEVDPEELLALQLSEKGNRAREIILNDLRLLADFGASPSLNLLKCYDRDDEFDFISTAVYSYHVDRSPIATDTFLCTYHGVASDIIPNGQAEQKVLIPKIRKKLAALHNDPSEEFEDFLKENYFVLHYQAQPHAAPVNLGLGHLWRLAVDHPQQRVLPCIHRAPIEREGGISFVVDLLKKTRVMLAALPKYSDTSSELDGYLLGNLCGIRSENSNRKNLF